ncbi:hypothetical protein RUM44_005967 [Polyplax serrata]|uniref:Uncharacterized protein n=1 Tax=Polyplax serrata TaxID=468196 RepID=A0ABR1AZA0_POLSC
MINDLGRPTGKAEEGAQDIRPRFCEFAVVPLLPYCYRDHKTTTSYKGSPMALNDLRRKVISQSLYDLNLFYQKCTNNTENRKVLAFNNGQKNEKRFNDDAIFMKQTLNLNFQVFKCSSYDS